MDRFIDWLVRLSFFCWLSSNPSSTKHRHTYTHNNSYFENVTAGYEWGSHPWPAFFLRAPSLPVYEKSVTEPKMLSDVSGDSEEVLLPTVEKLIDAIVKNRTANGALCVPVLFWFASYLLSIEARPSH
jgi:hypothetical protein